MTKEEAMIQAQEEANRLGVPNQREDVTDGCLLLVWQPLDDVYRPSDSEFVYCPCEARDRPK